MKEPIFITNFEFGQENEIHQLVKTVFDEFVAPDYSAEGVDFFYDWITPESILKRQQEERKILVALVDSKIVGIIELRNLNHISLLFVDKAYHRMGIASSLFKEAVFKILNCNPLIENIYVFSSPYAIPMYTKMGFIKTDSLQIKHGIKYLPMQRKIAASENFGLTSNS